MLNGRKARVVVSIAMGLSAIFAVGVLWYQGPESLVVRSIVVAAWLGLAAASTVWVARDASGRGLLAYAFPLAGLVGWFALIEPRNDRLWSFEMAHTLTYAQEGDRIAVSNVRNFRWNGPDAAEEKWELRRYDLRELKSVDVLSLYWKGPRIAHTYFSFVWADGEALSISVEIRKEAGEAYSPIAGFFKAYEIAILAGDERDFYGWRVFFPKEDIQLFRTRLDPRQARELLLALLDMANALVETPAFYNTLTNNCTTEAWLLTEAVGEGSPLNWRTLASGYLPDMLYDLKILDVSRPLTELRDRGHILGAARRAMAQGLEGPAFSTAIRAGVPEFPTTPPQRR